MYHLLVHINQDIKRNIEDLKVLKRAPSLLNNVKIGQGEIWFIMKHIFLPNMGVVAFLVK